MTTATKKIQPGYKQTEVGVIPEDWEVKTLDKIVEVRGGGTPSSFNKSFWNGSINWFTPTEIGYSKYVSESKRKITAEGLKNSSATILPVGSVLLTSRAGIGDTAILLNDACTNQGFQSLIAENIDNEFLYYLLNSFYFQKALHLNSSGSTFLEISPKKLKSILVAFPPTKSEQTAIATALSDMDALIAAQEQLIAKKRAIKQGAMQELLEKKEGWEEIYLKDCTWFQEGPGLRTWQFTKSGIKVINVTNLENGYLNLDRTDRHISLLEFKNMYQHFEIDENDIVVASSGNSYGKVAVVRKCDLPLLMNTSVIRFKPLQNLDYNYLVAYLKSNLFIDQIDLLITGGAQPNFGPYHLNKIKIHLPTSLIEQKNIGLILSDMDAEIEQLGVELAKYRDMKKGMMEELLTGRKRLTF